jgi:hypothetical protein
MAQWIFRTRQQIYEAYELDIRSLQMTLTRLLDLLSTEPRPIGLSASITETEQRLCTHIARWYAEPSLPFPALLPHHQSTLTGATISNSIPASAILSEYKDLCILLKQATIAHRQSHAVVMAIASCVAMCQEHSTPSPEIQSSFTALRSSVGVVSSYYIVDRRSMIDSLQAAESKAIACATWPAFNAVRRRYRQILSILAEPHDLDQAEGLARELRDRIKQDAARFDANCQLLLSSAKPGPRLTSWSPLGRSAQLRNWIDALIARLDHLIDWNDIAPAAAHRSTSETASQTSARRPRIWWNRLRRRTR